MVIYPEKRNLLPVRAAPVAVLGSSVGEYSLSILSTTRSAILFWSSSCVSLKSRIAVSFTCMIQEVETRKLKHWVVIRNPPAGTPIWNRRGCSSEILSLTPKGNHVGVVQRLLKKKKKKEKENLTALSLRVILCFFAEPWTRPWQLKKLALCPEHPKRDQNPKFMSLSETTSIPVCFIWECPPPPLG